MFLEDTFYRDIFASYETSLTWTQRYFYTKYRCAGKCMEEVASTCEIRWCRRTCILICSCRWSISTRHSDISPSTLEDSRELSQECLILYRIDWTRRIRRTTGRPEECCYILWISYCLRSTRRPCRIRWTRYEWYCHGDLRREERSDRLIREEVGESLP